MDSNGVSDDPVPFEVAVDIDGSTACALDYSNGRRPAGGADQLPAAVDRLGQPDRHLHAGRRRRARPTRATSGAIEIVTRPGSALPPRCIRRPASSTAGSATSRSRPSTRRVAQAMPDGRARLQRRRHLRPRLVGRPRGHRRAVDGRRAAPDRPGRLRARRRRLQPDARLRGGHPLSPRPRSGRPRTRGCWSGWSWPRTPAGPGRQRGGLGVDFSFHMLEDAWLTSAVERTETPRGASRAAAPRAPTRWKWSCPTAAARGSPR